MVFSSLQVIRERKKEREKKGEIYLHVSYLSRASISWSSIDMVVFGVSIETANFKSISCNYQGWRGDTLLNMKHNAYSIKLEVSCTQLLQVHVLTIHLPLFWLHYILGCYTIGLAFNMDKSTYFKNEQKVHGPHRSPEKHFQSMNTFVQSYD